MHPRIDKYLQHIIKYLCIIFKHVASSDFIVVKYEWKEKTKTPSGHVILTIRLDHESFAGRLMRQLKDVHTREQTTFY